MLYGNLIFIKKNGGDGSKFPVTERDIKIGRSEECLIRIHNPQVAPEHCQLIVEENGQATLRNLSNQTILNGKPLGHKDVVLCHGDIFKIGERLARWEYLQTSKYYRQLLSPTGRLVAVVMPQQRSLGDQTTPRASASQVTLPKTTPLGKRRYSERVTSESSSAVKMRKSSGSELIHKNRNELSKFFGGRHSLKATKLMFQGEKVKERRSISGMISSKNVEGQVGVKLRKSTLPLWKVNVVTPSGKKSYRNSLKKSDRNSVTLTKSSVKTPVKDITKPSKLLSASKSKMKMPQKTVVESLLSEEVHTSATKSVLRTPVKTVVESTPKSVRKSSRSTPMNNRSPSPKKSVVKLPSNIVLSTPKPKSPKFVRLVHSESKLNSFSKKSSLSKEKKRRTLMLEKVDLKPGQNLIKNLRKKAEKGKGSKLNTLEAVFDKISPAHLKTGLNNEGLPVKKTSSPRKTFQNSPAPKNSRRSKEIKISTNKIPDSAIKFTVQTPTKSEVLSTPVNLSQKPSRTSRIKMSRNFNVEAFGDHTDLNNTTSSGESFAENIPLKKNARLLQKIEKIETPSPTSKISISPSNSFLPSFSSPIDKTTALNSVRSSGRKQKLSMVQVSSEKSTRLSKVRTTCPRRLQRKLSPSSSAERAAKKLKTSSPRKPDKNKKAALLVLGKANRKHLSQNVKVLLKQKIVKKALKQSNAVSGNKDESSKKIYAKLKQGSQKAKIKQNSQRTKSKENKSSKNRTSLSQNSKADGLTINSPAKSKTQKRTPRDIKVLEASQLGAEKSTEGAPGVPSNQNKKSELPATNNRRTSPSSNFEKSAENYLLNSYRRCSKRLSSKNDTGRPDFIELSPTALGLIPKNLDIFKTPKDSKRRSSSLATPRNVQNTGIIKSASTSKIGNRKSVRFSPKNVSINSVLPSSNFPEKTELDFSSFHTPDITLDTFVSPIFEKNSETKKDMNKNSEIILFSQKIDSRSSKTPVTQLASYEDKNSENYVSEPKNVRQMFDTPKITKSPKNDSSDPNGVKKLLQTPKVQKSPKNDLTDVRGVKGLFQTPKVQKSPKNDLTDVRGVKKLLRTPKEQKSPKNDLTDVRGVKKLLQTPKVQKSPKNDLTDVRGVKKLLRTPKEQKSPKNDLTDVRGVKKLLRTPKVQKSPKNDLSDVRGIKKLLRTPKEQKSPKNDLTDVRGVKRLLQTPKIQVDPKNELYDLRGVKRLLVSPKLQKSPRNNLLDISGIGNLFESSSSQKLSRNSAQISRALTESLQSEENLNENLSNASEVKQLLISKSPESISERKKTVAGKTRVNDFRAIRGRRTIYSTPKGPKNDLSDLVGVRELFLRHQPPKDQNISLTGVAELFDEVVSKQKVAKDRKNSASEVLQKAPEARSLRRRRVLEIEDENDENTKTVTRGSRLRKALTEVTERRETKNLKMKVADLKETKSTKRKAVGEVKTNPAKKASVVKKSQEVTKKSRKPDGESQTKASSDNDNKEIKKTRKRKVSSESSDLKPPPKLARKPRRTEKSGSTATKETIQKGISSFDRGPGSEEEISVKSFSAPKVPVKRKCGRTPKDSSKVLVKTTLKISTEQSQKGQSNRSRNKTKNISKREGSEEKVSARKTRGVKRKTNSGKLSLSKAEVATVSGTSGKKNLSPTVKRSTRRKVN